MSLLFDVHNNTKDKSADWRSVFTFDIYNWTGMAMPPPPSVLSAQGIQGGTEVQWYQSVNEISIFYRRGS